MEHVLMLKVEEVFAGDSYPKTTWIELGDIVIDSAMRIQEVAKQVGEKMEYDNCRFEPKEDFPKDEEFYLSYDIPPLEWNPYPVKDTLTTESVRVKTYSVLKIHGKLFQLQPFEPND